MMGLYPVTGQSFFLIGSPWFSRMEISLAEGKNLTINSSGGDIDNSVYVQSLKVNGLVWTKSWVTWPDIFENGGTMDFILGSSPRRWATGEDPPSPASGQYL
jgi:putative alpha-1,2-mannosidase